jgi:hypothetical protein
MDLDEARLHCSARILGNELNAAAPTLGIDKIEEFCDQFLERTDK